MKNASKLLYNDEESPTDFADRLGILYSTKVTEAHKKTTGQFFTSKEVAYFMGDFAVVEEEKIKILDPGCGIGILSAALVEKILLNNSKLRYVELVAFETDSEILPYTEECFEYLRIWLQKHNVEFTFFLCKNDFVLHNAAILNKNENSNERYDIIISNPPYFKLSKDDVRIKETKSVTFGQSNIYSIFLLLAAKLLAENGQLIFITPRSFCSGNYFRVFRELFLSTVDLDIVHLFNSRSTLFKRDKVLQENVVIKARKKIATELNQTELLLDGIDSLVNISISNDSSDITRRRSKSYNISTLINFSSYQKIIHLPTDEIDEEVLKIFKTWTGSLNLYRMKISTGPIVDFRSEDIIRERKQKNSIPIYWMHNIRVMNIIWPKLKHYNDGRIKGQYLANLKIAKNRIVDNRNYVIVRRFSTKEDKRRLIAAPHLSDKFPQISSLGIENHLNYIYHQDRSLTLDETYGLSTLFSSKLFDLYFRTFNGNINVSATELRDFPLPPIELIREVGKEIQDKIHSKQSYNIDNIIAKHFHLSIDLFKAYE